MPGAVDAEQSATDAQRLIKLIEAKVPALIYFAAQVTTNAMFLIAAFITTSVVEENNSNTKFQEFHIAMDHEMNYVNRTFKLPVLSIDFYKIIFSTSKMS